MNGSAIVSVFLIAAFALILPRTRMGFPVPLVTPPLVLPPDPNGGSGTPGGEPDPQVGDPDDPLFTPPDLNGGSDPPGGEPGDEDRDLSGDYDDPGDDPGGQYDDDSTWDIPDSRGGAGPPLDSECAAGWEWSSSEGRCLPAEPSITYRRGDGGRRPWWFPDFRPGVSDASCSYIDLATGNCNSPYRRRAFDPDPDDPLNPF